MLHRIAQVGKNPSSWMVGMAVPHPPPRGNVFVGLAVEQEQKGAENPFGTDGAFPVLLLGFGAKHGELVSGTWSGALQHLLSPLSCVGFLLALL